MAGFPLSYVTIEFIENLYKLFKEDPLLVDDSWRYFFEGMEFAHPLGSKGQQDRSKLIDPAYLLIHAYRMYGHLAADIDPIVNRGDINIAELDYRLYGLAESDLSQMCSTYGLMKASEVKVSELLAFLKSRYAGKIGIEYLGFVSHEMEKFIETQVQRDLYKPLDAQEEQLILDYLNKAELFETFIHTKFVGQKRFSLEGSETLLPMMAFLLDKGCALGVEQVVLGMAHRGRLNVLANILNKPYSKIFDEFQDDYLPTVGQGTGDVKYHKGFEGYVNTTSGKQIHLTLGANPSHLESIGPVVEGRARAQQEAQGAGTEKVLPIIIHGDASIAGQGVVYETIQLNHLDGYSTGGTIHLVINNQIGFTTTAKETRSTRYCTDIAKAFGCPVLHVNAEDPESCVRGAVLAIELRQKFGCDVFIDLNCYRKYGHNEGDEPFFTQPLQYQVIRAKHTIREQFKQRLLAKGVLTQSVADQQELQFKNELEKALTEVSQQKDSLTKPEAYYLSIDPIEADIPAIEKEDLIDFTKKLSRIPDGFALHPKVAKLFADRVSVIEADSQIKKIDWGFAESLSFATILSRGVSLRLSGQDCQRGTFSQRHAVWVDQKTGDKYFPLQQLAPKKGGFEVLNSPLSEYAVLGFDLGYSLSSQNTLTLWEAQYGDFANTAQVIIDQYLSALEQKWNLSSNITLLLPHGYEGQGPEHSSARMERYLQLAAQGNCIIANCSTPAQYYHLLRRQAYLKKKKPLIIFSPKALLRHPGALSSLDELSSGHFHTVLSDNGIDHAATVLFCSGKVYYDLIQEKGARTASDVAIIRIEQLYPFPDKEIREIMQRLDHVKKIRWVQEEHRNMGAYEYVRPILQEIVGQRGVLEYIGRPRAASTAAGSYALHKKQYQKMMEEAFA
jgi:2-oxoglutarate dehydrogenase E1 component